MKSITAYFPTLMFFRLNNVCPIQFITNTISIIIILFIKMANKFLPYSTENELQITISFPIDLFPMMILKISMMLNFNLEMNNFFWGGEGNF